MKNLINVQTVALLYWSGACAVAKIHDVTPNVPFRILTDFVDSIALETSNKVKANETNGKDQNGCCLCETYCTAFVCKALHNVCMSHSWIPGIWEKFLSNILTHVCI